MVRFQDESAIDNRTLFTGRELDPESGYYHYRTRTYDPVHGRFSSIDNIGIWGDPVNRGNGYAYVGNGPGGRVVPMGMESSDCNYYGPDVKDAVLAAGRRLIDCFCSWSLILKYRTCYSLLPVGVIIPEVGAASNAWDLSELSPFNNPPEVNGCPSDFYVKFGVSRISSEVGCGRSCVPNDEVNYYILGDMFKQSSIWVKSHPLRISATTTLPPQSM